MNGNSIGCQDERGEVGAAGGVPASLLELVAKTDPRQAWFTPKEVAAILNRTDQFVRDLVENGRILGHALNARGRRRKSYQIHRIALELYLLQTANFGPDELTKSILRLVDSLPRKQADAIRRVI
jgi:excisionase family DNA binding protein